jgi:hypothetical protein
MSPSGQLRKCEGRIAFRIDPGTLPAGARLRRYHMHRQAQQIDRMQKVIQAGSRSLAGYLLSPEWRQLDLSDGAVGPGTDALKMMVILEAIFEHARRRLASPLPSRLDCVFVWPALDPAI